MSITCNDTVLAANLSKDAAKEGIDISSYLKVGERSQFKLWLAAVAKKPASAIQEISSAARGEALADEVSTLTAGKLKLKKGFEAYNEEKGKWGGLPKIDSSCTILVRKSATAKGGKESDTTYAAGPSMKMIVTYGVTDEAKGKSGVISVVIEGAKTESSGSGSGNSTESGSGTSSGSGT